MIKETQCQLMYKYSISPHSKAVQCIPRENKTMAPVVKSAGGYDAVTVRSSTFVIQISVTPPRTAAISAALSWSSVFGSSSRKKAKQTCSAQRSVRAKKMIGGQL